MKKVLLIPIILFFVACSAENSAKYEVNENSEVEFEDALEIPATERATRPAQQQQAPAEEKTRKLIKTGGLDFQSEDIDKDYQKIRALLPKYNAYIEHETQLKDPYRITFDVTIRVPSAVYDTLYSSLTSLAYRVDNRHSNVEDATMKYYDLLARISNKKALEARYVSLLKKASKIKDIMEIEEKLNETRVDIEQLQGQFNYLSKQVSYSTIHLKFYEIIPYEASEYKEDGFGTKLLKAFKSGWEGLLSFLVALAVIWPFILVLVSGIFLFRKLRTRNKQRRE
ncbi:DUF4349 domain-containing protein [Fulvivirga sediminis]|uniref:DUF4349 domain-containing protein n=1 Tax=Fulvivirga sediminis TaxID=2803949 RepID=A0A937K0E0_9BACT|nr:DUF4349 domain-containing protein [Fulvivirga sediminis]MBL3658268.1 DUF4349 domain-containing protein [Fulvivirga sediminis]